MKIKTDEVIAIDKDNIFENDQLDRKVEVENLSEIIFKLSEPCVIAINGEWGCGKTTFVRFLDKHLRNENFKTTYFNAWENDYEKEPFLLILNHIVNEFTQEKETKQEIHETALKILKSALSNGSKAIGNYLIHTAIEANLKELAEDISPKMAKFIFDNLDEEKSEIKKLKKLLTELIEDDKKLIVIIDELDRCKPDFSIQLLERVKHIFNTESLVFILAADLNQLGKAVSGIYGESYDGRKYLERFFDIEYQLNMPDYSQYWDSLLKTYSGKDNIKTLDNQAIIKEFGLWLINSLRLNTRDIKRLYNRVFLSSLACEGEDILPLVIILTAIRSGSDSVYQNLKSYDAYASELFTFLQCAHWHRQNQNDGTFLKVLNILFNIVRLKNNTTDIGMAKKEFLDDLKRAIYENSQKTIVRNEQTILSNLNARFSEEILKKAFDIVDLQIKINYELFESLSRSTHIGWPAAPEISSK